MTQHIAFQIAGRTGRAVVWCRQNGDVIEQVSRIAEEHARQDAEEKDISTAVTDERGRIVGWDRMGIRVAA